MAGRQAPATTAEYSVLAASSGSGVCYKKNTLIRLVLDWRMVGTTRDACRQGRAWRVADALRLLDSVPRTTDKLEPAAACNRREAITVLWRRQCKASLS